jgi:preprotein translocase subunit SecG
MKYTITIIQMITAIILMVLILLQNKGGGLSGLFGGGDGGNVFRTKRGMEKNLFILTIIFSVIFIGLSLSTLFVF